MLAWFAETTLVAAALAVLATLIGRFGRLGPAARHALWFLVLLKLLTPPLLHWPRLEPPRKLANTAPAPLIPRPDPEPESGLAYPISVVPVDDSWELAEPEPIPEPPPPKRDWATLRALAEPWIIRSWAAVAIVIAGGNVGRIVRFRRGLGRSSEPPDWLTELVESLALRFEVRPPRVVVVEGIESPLIWCLGRPKLLVPLDLIRALAPDRWPGIVAHELAHLRRRDHWVSRLVLVAGILWWWNPIAWLVRRRLEAEAEMACDAWVVGLLPGKRRAYAETLIDVCESLANVRMPAPALGVGGGPGRFFERRLTMILNGRVPYRVSRPGLMTLGLLATLALPSWSPGQDEPDKAKEAEKPGTEVRVIEVVPDLPAPVVLDSIEVQDFDTPKHQINEQVRTAFYRLPDVARVIHDYQAVEAKLQRARLLARTGNEPTIRRFADQLADLDSQFKRLWAQYQPELAAMIAKADDDDDDADSGKDKKRRVEIRVRKEADEDSPKDVEKLAGELDRARKELEEASEAMRKTQERLNQEMRAAAERMAKARARVAKLKAGLRGTLTIERLDPRTGLPLTIDVRPVPPSPVFRARVLPPAPDVDRRLNELEKKFDRLLDELKDIKKQKGADAPRDDHQESRNGQFDFSIGAKY